MYNIQHYASCIVQLMAMRDFQHVLKLKTCGAGGFAFGYWASKLAGLPEKAARTNSIEVEYLVTLHPNHCLPILASKHSYGNAPCTCLLGFPRLLHQTCLYAYSSEQQRCIKKCSLQLCAQLYFCLWLNATYGLFCACLCSMCVHPCKTRSAFA